MTFKKPNLYCLELYEKKFILRLSSFLPIIKIDYRNLKKLKIAKKKIYFITKKDKKLGIRRTAITEENVKKLIKFLSKYCETEID
ncbi:hypothetical protein [Caldisalinibacter kiritimatiensis]|uniref:hypothetical protein n=1 Tax=Caldisalinibacter kiritimatiensis TaxID=1304284 RepID=UPI00138B0A4B|nr:hypothetical protein [Caldisalinibacter kiritimatiensis]